VGDEAPASDSRILRTVPTGRLDELRLAATRDLDFATERQARAELRAAMESSGPTEWTQCLLDASRVFVDVRGLEVLLEGAELARSLGRELMVVAPRSLRVMCQALDVGDRLPLRQPPMERGTADGGVSS
jgi:hypothetical protein